MKSSPRTPNRVRGQAAREAEGQRPAARRRVGVDVPRTRRSAPEARKRILEAAQRELLRVGPSALRLTDLARQLQVSHPAILHHFGSREGLVAAVVRHSMQALTQQLMAAFDAANVKRIDRAELIELVASVCGQGGLARLLAFLLLQNRAGHERASSQMALKPLVDTAHELRQRFGHPASYEDTRFEIQLIAVALLGD
ncbi:MAG TPA: TetR/AcrR family transcriptional regulator, partial [Polyangiales bacterium]|nr:TetR/AcrR family transcriptional regulator [Polyangiales bacterium]